MAPAPKGARKKTDFNLIAIKYKDSWGEYPDDALEMLRKEYLKGKNTVDFVLHSEIDPESPKPQVVVTKYTVDFRGMKHTNGRTKKTCEIRFVKKTSGKLLEIAIPPGVPSSISSKDERTKDDCGNIMLKVGDGWMEYPDDVFERLQFTWVHGYDLVEFTIQNGDNQAKYFANFSTMKQTNQFNAESTDIRFSPKREKLEGSLTKPVTKAPPPPKESPQKKPSKVNKNEKKGGQQNKPKPKAKAKGKGKAEKWM